MYRHDICLRIGKGYKCKSGYIRMESDIMPNNGLSNKDV